MTQSLSPDQNTGEDVKAAKATWVRPTLDAMDLVTTTRVAGGYGSDNDLSPS